MRGCPDGETSVPDHHGYSACTRQPPDLHSRARNSTVIATWSTRAMTTKFKIGDHTQHGYHPVACGHSACASPPYSGTITEVRPGDYPSYSVKVPCGGEIGLAESMLDPA